MQQRLQQVQQELETARVELERLRSERSTHGEMSRTSLGQLHSEIARLRQQVEDRT